MSRPLPYWECMICRAQLSLDEEWWPHYQVCLTSQRLKLVDKAVDDAWEKNGERGL